MRLGILLLMLCTLGLKIYPTTKAFKLLEGEEAYQTIRVENDDAEPVTVSLFSETGLSILQNHKFTPKHEYRHNRMQNSTEILEQIAKDGKAKLVVTMNSSALGEGRRRLMEGENHAGVILRRLSETKTVNEMTALNTIDAAVMSFAETEKYQNDIKEFVDALIAEEEIKFVEVDVPIGGDSWTPPNDEMIREQWALAYIDIVKAWKIDNGLETPKPMVVLVSDTGVEYTHPDLKNRMWINEAEAKGQEGVDDDGNGFIDDIHGWNFHDNNNNPMDDNGHGTHIAGIIAAEPNNEIGISGIHWGARILPCKCMGADNKGLLSNCAKCLDYGLMMGVDLSSNSYGSDTPLAMMEEMIGISARLDKPFISSAGNRGENIDAKPRYPSSYQMDNQISVASIDEDGSFSSWSNYGPNTVDIAAPGSYILSTYKGNSWAAMLGTSVACPVIAGAVALLKSAVPSLTTHQIKNILSKTTQSTLDEVSWGGAIDLGQALHLAKLVEPCLTVEDAGKVINVAPGETIESVVRIHGPGGPWKGFVVAESPTSMSKMEIEVDEPHVGLAEIHINFPMGNQIPSIVGLPSLGIPIEIKNLGSEPLYLKVEVEDHPSNGNFELSISSSTWIEILPSRSNIIKASCTGKSASDFEMSNSKGKLKFQYILDTMLTKSVDLLCAVAPVEAKTNSGNPTLDYNQDGSTSIDFNRVSVTGTPWKEPFVYFGGLVPNLSSRPYQKTSLDHSVALHDRLVEASFIDLSTHPAAIDLTAGGSIRDSDYVEFLQGSTVQVHKKVLHNPIIAISEKGYFTIDDAIENDKGKAVVGPFQAEIALGRASGIFVYSTPDAFVVQWHNMISPKAPESSSFTFQVIMTNFGQTIFCYKDFLGSELIPETKILYGGFDGEKFEIKKDATLLSNQCASFLIESSDDMRSSSRLFTWNSSSNSKISIPLKVDNPSKRSTFDFVHSFYIPSWGKYSGIYSGIVKVVPQ
eukprot:GHVP01000728.1.p1 GENE.GHVP01000728.1~~GHVP01000728.1.p1  ORF type:complete len:977 (-),score=209.44 GHVP01000728.1:1341-4271(-)